MSITVNRASTIPRGQSVAKRGARQSLFLALLALSAIAASLLTLKFAPAPFFWLLLTWAAALWLAMIGIHGSWPRAVLLNLGIVASLLAGAEAYLATHEYTTTIFSEGF